MNIIGPKGCGVVSLKIVACYVLICYVFHNRSDDTSDEHSYFGRKYVGVGTGGTLEIHAEKKLSWTFLNKTLHPGEGNENSYHFDRSWGNRGIIVHVIEPTTGQVLRTDRLVFLLYFMKEAELMLLHLEPFLNLVLKNAFLMDVSNS